MTARIARGSAPRGKAPVRRAGRGKSKSRKGSPDGFADVVRRISGWIFVAMLVAVALAALLVLRIPQMIGATTGELIGEMGFSVKHVEIKGAVHVPKLEVYNIAFDQPSSAMPLVDLEGTRERLLRFGWVREARVSRRLPDTLVVDIVERRPAAIWQHNRKLALIDIDGVVLEAVRLEAMPDLPLVIGPAANLHAAELRRLVEAAPQLKPVMAGASWVGGRRWDLRFQSGELLALPEGEEAAKKALGHFAKMDQATQLLGRGFPRFDMRIPGKFIVRVSNQPGSSVPAMLPEAAPQAGSPAAAQPPPSGIDASKTI
jgi:cell division protein FtsQ